jgi:uncharacterized protein (TIGR03492 family)
LFALPVVFVSKKRILCLSNGHGEDQIAARIVEALLAYDVEILALPIVGEGNVYRRMGIEIVVPTRTMPSGGFIYMDAREFFKDLRGGLGKLTWLQWQTIRRLAPQCDFVLAVGDIVVMALAFFGSAPFAFVGTAKSDYYLGGKPSDYTVIEKWLLTRPHCRAVFPRDALTAQNLQTDIPRAIYLGNPMMDRLEPSPNHPGALPNTTTIVLLPGSRAPEAYRNLGQMLDAVSYLPETLNEKPLRFLCALAGSLSDEELANCRPQWHLQDHTLQSENRKVELCKDSFADCIHGADLAIAMAGTAAEQCVGLGMPVVTMPGEGPQFTYRFAEAQTRLLGESIQLVTDGPQAVAQRIRDILADPQLQERIRINGEARMGQPGAASRIAEYLVGLIDKQPKP